MNETPKNNSHDLTTKNGSIRKKSRAAKSYFTPAAKETRVKLQPQKNRAAKVFRTVNGAFHKAEKALTKPSVNGTFLTAQELPEQYLQTFVSLIPRDPFCLYVYWEINSAAVDKMKEEFSYSGELTYTLRVYDVTFIDFNGSNANGWFDLDGLHMNNRYISPVNENTGYCVEIGVRSNDGRFYSFARSNSVVTPRKHPSWRSELIWKDANTANGEKLPFVTVCAKKDALKKIMLHRNSFSSDTQRVSLSVEDVKSYYSKGKTIIQLMKLGLRDANGNIIYQINGQDGLSVESVEGTSLFESTYLKTTPFGSSDHLTEKVIERKADFPFELETELIVRGKTKPQAQVYWAGKKINVSSDGTFAFQLSLQDGLLPLEFKAVYEGDQKNIKTSVIRTKTIKDFRGMA